MATLNFTNSFLRSFFSFFGFPSKHEKISYSGGDYLPDSPVFDVKNISALRMLGRTFCFKYRDQNKNLHFTLGTSSVVSVVISIDNGPEIGLLSDSCDFIDIIPLSDLVVQHEVIRS